MQEHIQKIKAWPAQWKVVAIIVALLVVAGIGMALQGGGFLGGSDTASSIFGIKRAPSLIASVKYSAELTPEARKILEDTIAEFRTELGKNENNYDMWLSLAIRYKQAGDFNKAREVWEYLASIHPDDSVSRHNLGDLYHHFLNDYRKAEAYYKAALDLDPTNELDYLALYELYRYNYKQDTTAAVDILKKGIENVTENQPVDLYVALANYYADKGQKADARDNYTKARDIARTVGNTQLVAQLNEAIAALGQ